MPTYEYICEKCEHLFEAFQSIVSKPLKKCPECSGKVKRLISGGSGVLFKGSGFYQTDYRSKNYQDSAKKDSEAGKPSVDKKSESKSSEPTKKAKKSADK